MRRRRCAARRRAAISKPACSGIASRAGSGSSRNRSTTCSTSPMPLSARHRRQSSAQATASISARSLLEGCRARFAASAAAINSGTDGLGRRVVEIADLAKRFGTHLDEIAGGLGAAATELEADAGQMAAAAEKTSRETAGVISASSHASTNVASVAGAAGAASVLDRRDRPPGRLVLGEHQPRGQRSQSGRQRDSQPCRRGGADWRRRQADQRDCRSDQPARAQRHYRGGAGRRGGPRLCRSGIRG